jgi:ABC-type branched-chain amino acid transport system, permease component
MNKILKRSSRENIFTYAMVIISFIGMKILIAAGSVNSVLQGQLVPICAYAVMALSLNLTVGVLGELSLGHAGFMSVGAFSGVVASFALEQMVPWVPLRLALSMGVGAACAAAAGMLVGVPVLRLAGDYLAIVTLAFGEIIKNLITCLYVGIDDRGLHFSFLGNASDLHLQEGGRVIVNGPMGIAGIQKLSSFSAGFALLLVALFVLLNLINSRSGRAIMALRDNQIAAESVGIPVTKYKMMAFVTSAALAGAAGALYAMNYSTVVASKFNFNTSILILVFVVLGGLGKMWGSIIAAVVLTVLPELLRGFNDYRMLVYAIVLILVMLATNNQKINDFLGRVRSGIVGAFKKPGEEGEPNA